MADELVERLLTDIADMMSQHVENWPYPRKIDTAIALISKTLDAALTDAVPRDVAESWKAKAENLSAARKEAATEITRLTEASAAQAREIEGLRAWRDNDAVPTLAAIRVSCFNWDDHTGRHFHAMIRDVLVAAQSTITGGQP